MDNEDLQGAWAAEAEAALPSTRFEAESRRVLELGLQAAPSIKDRSISLFARSNTVTFMGVNTFLSAPYLEDARTVSHYAVAFLGEPLDTGTTYRAGTQFAPQAMRRASALTSLYNFELGMDLGESLTMCDLGDVYVIPANIEKSFDQISLAMSHVYASGAFPVVLGGDHSVGYPNVRGIAPHVDGNIGIVHFDRHSDTDETNIDERMHGTPFFHATNIPNAPPANLVQIGIGGRLSSRTAVAISRDRRGTVITLDDIDRLGIARTIELALEEVQGTGSGKERLERAHPFLPLRPDGALGQFVGIAQQMGPAALLGTGILVIQRREVGAQHPAKARQQGTGHRPGPAAGKGVEPGGRGTVRRLHPEVAVQPASGPRLGHAPAPTAAVAGPE